MAKERLHKIIALSGYCSRRKAEELIAAGSVKVNGITAVIGDRVDETRDVISIKGQKLNLVKDKVYFILNKPPGFESTSESVGGNKTIFDLCRTNHRVFPVGRLDKESRGLVLLTNDGELTNLITHPSSSPGKKYKVTVLANISDDALDKMQKGIELEEGMTRPCRISVSQRSSKKTVLIFTLYEGKKRQIRRMIQAVGYRVKDLVRTSIGPLKLSGIKEGQCRQLSKAEIRDLKEYLEKKRRKKKLRDK